jgi:hypothetical protein
VKTISMIGIAAVLSLPALAAAQRGGGAGAGAISVQRVQVQRIDVGRVDTGRTLTARDIDIRRGNADGGETGTRLRRRDDGPDRRPPHDPARRRWNAAHPSDSDPSRPNAGR